MRHKRTEYRSLALQPEVLAILEDVGLIPDVKKVLASGWTKRPRKTAGPSGIEQPLSFGEPAAPVPPPDAARKPSTCELWNLLRIQHGMLALQALEPLDPLRA